MLSSIEQLCNPLRRSHGAALRTQEELKDYLELYYKVSIERRLLRSLFQEEFLELVADYGLQDPLVQEQARLSFSRGVLHKDEPESFEELREALEALR